MVEYNYNDSYMIPSALRLYDDFRKSVLIQKAVLSDNNIVMINYGHGSKLGYCRQSDSVDPPSKPKHSRPNHIILY